MSEPRSRLLQPRRQEGAHDRFSPPRPPTEHATAWILPFTSGGFLYIALVNVVPDLLEESSLRYSLHSSDGEGKFVSVKVLTRGEQGDAN